MKKTYIAPNCKIRVVEKCNIIATSGGVGDGGILGRSYDSGAASYGRGNDDWDWDWDDED